MPVTFEGEVQQIVRIFNNAITLTMMQADDLNGQKGAIIKVHSPWNFLYVCRTVCYQWSNCQTIESIAFFDNRKIMLLEKVD